jgi:ketosteroid isomerase-like protein
MSQENVEIVRRADLHFAQTGEPLWEALHPDVTSVDWDVPESEDYVGHDGVRKWLANWASAWDHFEMDFEGYRHADDKVVSLFTMRATGRGSGITLERKDAILFSVENRLITRLEYFNDQAAALEAAGLSEKDAHGDSS